MELSERELEVIGLTLSGLTNEEIGERLFISPKTVDTHLQNARRAENRHSKHSSRLAIVEWIVWMLDNEMIRILEEDAPLKRALDAFHSRH